MADKVTREQAAINDYLAKLNALLASADLRTIPDLQAQAVVTIKNRAAATTQAVKEAEARIEAERLAFEEKVKADRQLVSTGKAQLVADEGALLIAKQLGNAVE